MTRLVVVGGGNMGSALIGGLVRAGGIAENEITVVEPRQETRAGLVSRFPGLTVVTEAGGVVGVATGSAGPAAIVAVKPLDVPEAARAIAPGGFSPVLSIAAGVTTAQLEGYLLPGTPVVRAMPNTPALVGSGAAAIAPGRNAGEADLRWAEEVLSSVGIVVRVPETLLDAVTGLSGSGPGFIFLVAEAMIEAGMNEGIDYDTSALLTAQTLAGAGRLILETGERPERLREAVTSPGGTTAAGLKVLEERGVHFAFFEAIAAATRRAASSVAAEPATGAALSNISLTGVQS